MLTSLSLQEATQDDDEVARVKSELLLLEMYEDKICDRLFEELEEVRTLRGIKERAEVKAVKFFRDRGGYTCAFYELKSHKQ